MKKNNAGMSIVELIIVIAIAGVILGFGIYGIGQITGYRARECSKKISSSISANKVLTLGKAKSTGNICWELYKKDGDYYVRTVREAGTSNEYYEDIEQVSEGRVNVVYVEETTGGTQTQFDVDATNSLRFCFNRASGAICRAASPYKVHDVKQILVSAGSREYKIELVPATGKVVQ